MPLLTDVGAYLASTSGANVGLTIGSTGNLFLVPFPETAPVASACLIEYASGEPSRAMGASLSAPIAGEVPRFQVIVRDEQNNFATARALIESIYVAIDGLLDQTLGSTRYLLIKALQPPFYLKQDENDRHYFVFNVEARKVRG